MFVAMDCSHCQQHLRVLSCYQGRTVRCPGCGATLTLVMSAPAVKDARAAASVSPSRPLPDRSASSHPGAPARCGASPAPTVDFHVERVPALAALGIPLLAGAGVFEFGLAISLAVLCLFLGRRQRWSLAVRLGLGLVLASLGYGVALAVPLLASADGPTDQAPTRLTPVAARNNALTMPSPRLASVPPPLPQRTDLRLVDNLGELLAVAIGTRTAPDGEKVGDLLVTTADGSLRHHSYPDLRFQRTARLRQPAYRAVLDSRLGGLWVASSSNAPRASNHTSACSGRHHLHKKKRGDLHFYDVGDLLSGRLAADTVLRPTAVLPLDGHVFALLPDPERGRLYCLAEDAQGTHVARIDAASRAREIGRPLPPETNTLCLAPDGKTLYATRRRALLEIDADTLEVRKTVPLSLTPCDVVAGNDGRIFLAERGHWPAITVLDKDGSVIGQWPAGLHGRIHLGLSPDRQRLYVGTSSPLGNSMRAYYTSGQPGSPPLPLGVANGDADNVLRGDFALTPDGQFLVNRWGTVLRLEQPPTVKIAAGIRP
jgi:hypothetical protein